MAEIIHEVEIHETPAPRTHSLLTKILTIIGFCATVVLIVWLITEGIKRLPEGFASLAGIADTIHEYRPLAEIELTTEKEVVNSGETFLVSWTDVHDSGTYALQYACSEGVTLEARDHDGNLIPFACNEALSFPATTHSVSVRVLSTEQRFATLTFTITFTDTKGANTRTDDGIVRVVNVAIPVKETVSEDVKPLPEVPTPSKPSPVKPQPIVTITHPQSDPQGYVDLKVTTLGAGTLVNGTFIPTAYYSHDFQNAIKFDIKNIGTKTSDTWTFTTKLPSGVIYKSKPQVALKPLEHVEFTLSFGLDSEEDDSTKVTTTVFTDHDQNSDNNASAWTVMIDD